MSKNQLRAGSFLSYIQMGLNVIIQLVYTPVMIRLLGRNEYGLYNTVASTIAMLSVLSLGFNSGYIRYYSIYKKRNDKSSIEKLNGLFFLIFIVIGIVAFLCGLFLSYHLDLVFDKGLTSLELKKAKILMLLLTVNLSISFIMSVFQNIISAHERFVFLKFLGIIKTILSPLISLPLLLNGFRSIALVCVTVSVTFFIDVIYLVYVLLVMKQKFVFSGFEKGLFRDLFTYTVFIAINIAIDQVNCNVDKLLLGRFRGTAEVAAYSVGFTLHQAYMMFSTAISGVFTPRIHNIINATKHDINEQKLQLTDLFIRVGRIQYLVLALICTGIVFFGKYFIVNIWAGDGYDNSYYVALLLNIPAIVPLIQNLGIEIQRAENKHHFRSIVYAIMALINLCLSIFLCKRYGAIGSVVGTAIALVIANGFIMNYYYHKHCNIDILLFWRHIIRLSSGLVLPIICGVLMMIFFSIESMFSFLICVASYTIIYMISMWFIGMNNFEKNLVIDPAKKLLKKLSKNQ